MNKKFTTRHLVIMSVMIAITLILDYTPLGVIPLPIVSATIIHLPTIVTGIILGPLAGAIVGAGMGVISLVHAITRPPSALAPLFWNPLVSILPRIFIGVASYYAYIGMKKALGKFSKLKQTISVGVGAFVGSMTNTVLVLGMLYIVYNAEVEEIFNSIPEMAGLSALDWVVATATGQGILEAIVIVVLTIPIVFAWQQINRNRIS